jgi:hypothetical protein
MTALPVIPHIYNGVTILQRGDGYWNATEMCRANEKLWADYWRKKYNGPRKLDHSVSY